MLSFRETPGWGGGGEQHSPALKLHTAPAKYGGEREKTDRHQAASKPRGRLGTPDVCSW